MTIFVNPNLLGSLGLVLISGIGMPLTAQLTPLHAMSLLHSSQYPILGLSALLASAMEDFDQVSIITIAGVVGYLALICIALRYILKASRLSTQLGKANKLLEEQKAGLNAFHTLLEEQEQRKPLPAKVSETLVHPDDDDRLIVLVQGGIGDVLGIVRPDVIVNSENDFLMLGRPFDKNFSGTLRYLDAEKDAGHRIERDSLEITLRKRLGAQPLPVRVGSVFETNTTELSRQGVKLILHVATVQPSLQGGYYTNARQIPGFVRSCFEKISDLIINGADISTVLFPLIGAGDGGVPPDESAGEMIPAIVEQMNRFKGIRATYVIAYRGIDLLALHDAAVKHGLAPMTTGVDV